MNFAFSRFDNNCTCQWTNITLPRTTSSSILMIFVNPVSDSRLVNLLIFMMLCFGFGQSIFNSIILVVFIMIRDDLLMVAMCIFGRLVFVCRARVSDMLLIFSFLMMMMRLLVLSKEPLEELRSTAVLVLVVTIFGRGKYFKS